MSAHGADVLRSRIAEVEGRLGELLRAHEELRGRFGTQRSETAEALKQADELFKTRVEAAGRQLEQQSERMNQEVQDDHARDLARIERAYSNASSRTGNNSSDEVARLAGEKKNAIELAVTEGLEQAMGEYN